ncbi:hypothetical protein JAAARDRAFT_59294 [Jaapia argillacea MUCL 33604]|uniref:Ubiquitin-like domain-containing protein n=1 Tax=Jaapia argillacea MUCL 33604 TaxID=933084 RepID=A0A067PYU2_9AGAM|nr:hypothetical protein JAAARDRAFT_59294 [Jaapia argillacea MUCL 33604]
MPGFLSRSPRIRILVLHYGDRKVATYSSNIFEVIQQAACRLFDLNVQPSDIIIHTKFSNFGEELIEIDPLLWPQVHSTVNTVWVTYKELPGLLKAVDSVYTESTALSIFERAEEDTKPYEIEEHPAPPLCTLFVKSPCGELHTIPSVDLSSSLHAFQQRIAEVVGISVGLQRLLYRGFELPAPQKTLAEYGITGGSTIEMARVKARTRPVARKPVIYLFPPKEMDVKVELGLKGSWEFETVYPVVDVVKGKEVAGDGESICWDVVARPDGNITEKGTGVEVSYLYWEALVNPRASIDTPPTSRPASPSLDVEIFDPARPVLTPTNSILLPTASVPSYLDKTLFHLGLNVEARTSFITYWLPAFHTHTHIALLFLPQTSYSAAAPLNITPKPDRVLRVFMLFKGVSGEDVGLWESGEGKWDWREVVGVNGGEEREGGEGLFRVVEWGGMEVV